MDLRFVDMRIRLKRMLKRIELYNEHYCEIINLIDGIEAKSISEEDAMNEIERRLDIIDPPGKVRLS